MEYGKNYIERQTNIQDISLSDIWDYFRKREGSFKCSNDTDSLPLTIFL